MVKIENGFFTWGKQKNENMMKEIKNKTTNKTDNDYIFGREINIKTNDINDKIIEEKNEEEDDDEKESK